MALNKDWREFLELLNFRSVDWADLATVEGITFRCLVATRQKSPRNLEYSYNRTNRDG